MGLKIFKHFPKFYGDMLMYNRIPRSVGSKYSWLVSPHSRYHSLASQPKEAKENRENTTGSSPDVLILSISIPEILSLPLFQVNETSVEVPYVQKIIFGHVYWPPAFGSIVGTDPCIVILCEDIRPWKSFSRFIRDMIRGSGYYK